MDIKHVGDQECISCGECIDVCPTKAISWKGPKIFIAPNEIQIPENATEKQIERITAKNRAEAVRVKKRNTTIKIAIVSTMAAILVGVLLYANVIHPMLNKVEAEEPPVTDTDDVPTDTDAPTDAPKPPVGNKVGNLCPSYELSLFDGNGVKDTKLDPSKTGKVTVINFWGKWCTSCVAELPYFDRIATDYKDKINVIAVHTHSLFDTAADYVMQYYKDSDIIFTKDNPIDPNDEYSAEEFFKKLGGGDAYPITIIIDENGVIIATIFNALTYDTLKEIVDTELNKYQD